MATIVRDEDIRSGTPRIDGTRITVLDCGHPRTRAGEASEDSYVMAHNCRVK